VDTNILVYAHRRESRFHDQAEKLVRELAEGQPAWGIPWPCVYEFFSVVTNPKIWKKNATSPDKATEQIEAWTSSPSVTLLGETVDFKNTLLPLINQPRIRGPVVHDSRIAALCMAHGIEKLWTKDRDFQLFPELVTEDPLS